VEADEETDVEVGGDAGTGPDAGGAAKSRCKTRLTVAKQSVSMVAAVVSTMMVAKEKKRKVSPPLAVETSVIPTPHSREVESEE
jgi:hypothetical protein